MEFIYADEIIVSISNKELTKIKRKIKRCGNLPCKFEIKMKKRA